MARADDFDYELRSLLRRAGDALYREFEGVDPTAARVPEVLYDIGDWIGVDYRTAMEKAATDLSKWMQGDE